VAAGQPVQATALLEEVEPLLDVAAERAAGERLRGEALLLAGDNDGALAFLEHAAELAASPVVPASLRAQVELTRGAVHAGLGDSARAIRCFEAARAATLLERLDMRRLQARVLLGLGDAHAAAGHDGAARSHLERAHAAARGVADPGLLLRSLAGLAESAEA